jgi:hypothetical protein
MASSRNEALYAAVETDALVEDIPVAEAIEMQSVEVQAPCDLLEGYQLSVEMQGKKIVVAVVCIINVAFVFETCISASPYSVRSRISCDVLRYVAGSLDNSNRCPGLLLLSHTRFSFIAIICSPQAVSKEVKTSMR